MGPRIMHHASRITVLCIVAFALAGSAWADIAPPEQAPGSSISPGGQTQVVMAAERVVIEVQPFEETAHGKVTADFLMRNTGTSDELLNVRFPLSWRGSASGDFSTVEDFAAQVGGSVLTTTVITSTDPLASAGQTEPMKWVAFDVKFPAGQDTTVKVTYNIKAVGFPPSARFAYMLETGAGWKDSIGLADIVLRLPYAASNQNIFYSDSTPGSKIAGNEVSWHWDNLEPTPKDNLFVTILAPKAWQTILDARAQVSAKPNDASALAALARAYDGAVTSRSPLHDHDLFATLGEETYDLAIVADPNSAPLHAAYASSIWNHMAVQASIPSDDPNLRRVLAEISNALGIDTQNAEATALLAKIQPAVNGTIVLPTPVGSVSGSPAAQTTPVTRNTATAMSIATIQGTTETRPTSMLPLPMQTAGARPSATASASGTSPSGAGNTALLVIGIVALPLIAAIATFVLVSRKREPSE
jgi:hypothetical protein